MARSVATIYQSMLDEKVKYSSLNNLSNTSSTAIWKTWFYCIAVVIASFEQINDVFKKELTDMATLLPVGSKTWYAQKMLDYQEGYTLVYDRELGQLKYNTIDNSTKVIIGASCVNESDTVILKVAKDDGTGSLTNLTTEQVTSVNQYINDFKFAGVVTRLVSLPGDWLKLTMSIKVDKTKINTLGQLVSDTTKYPVEDTIVNYLKSFATTQFDDEFILIKLTDALQLTDGVINVNYTLVEAMPQTGTSYLDILATEFKTYKTTAGYLIIDPTHTLRTNINYV